MYVFSLHRMENTHSSGKQILSYHDLTNAIELDYKPEFIIEMEEDMNGTDSNRSRHHKQ
jgi:hypothetical protein